MKICPRCKAILVKEDNEEIKRLICPNCGWRTYDID